MITTGTKVPSTPRPSYPTTTTPRPAPVPTSADTGMKPPKGETQYVPYGKEPGTGSQEVPGYYPRPGGTSGSYEAPPIDNGQAPPGSPGQPSGQGWPTGPGGAGPQVWAEAPYGFEALGERARAAGFFWGENEIAPEDEDPTKRKGLSIFARLIRFAFPR